MNDSSDNQNEGVRATADETVQDGDEQEVIRGIAADADKFEKERFDLSTDDRKLARAVAMLLAILLTVVVTLWWNPSEPLWWLVTGMTVSLWAYALQPSLLKPLESFVTFMVDFLSYALKLLKGWRQVVIQFLNTWFWSRFQAGRTTDGR
jgi:type IV secretory pathway component VirB8